MQKHGLWALNMGSPGGGGFRDARHVAVPSELSVSHVQKSLSNTTGLVVAQHEVDLLRADANSSERVASASLRIVSVAIRCWRTRDSCLHPTCSMEQWSKDVLMLARLVPKAPLHEAAGCVGNLE